MQRVIKILKNFFPVADHFIRIMSGLGCALTFASEAKFEIEAKISFRLEEKKG
jgi:hypothetical protein